MTVTYVISKNLISQFEGPYEACLNQLNDQQISSLSEMQKTQLTMQTMAAFQKAVRYEVITLENRNFAYTEGYGPRIAELKSQLNP
jgi:hypothetical protein